MNWQLRRVTSEQGRSSCSTQLSVACSRSDCVKASRFPGNYSQRFTMSPVKAYDISAFLDLGALLDADFGMVSLESGNTRLVVHKAVLEARSPVFAAMLQDMEDEGSDTLSIPDIEGPVLQKLVSYLYTLRICQLQGMGPQLLAAADRYGVIGLREMCEQLLAAEDAN